MSLPRISVVIPSYQQGRFLEACLASVLGQRYPDLEVLVLDGGSDDETLDVLHRFEGDLAYWGSRPDGGQAAAINEGMRRATGEVLCWLNSDDLYLPGALLTVGRHFAGLPSEQLVYGSALAFSEHPDPVWCAPLPSRPFDRAALAQSDFIVQPSAFWRRDLWTQVGELNEGLHYVLDWDWFLRASTTCSFGSIPEVLSLYRFHAEHKTSGGGSDRRSEILELVRRHADEAWVSAYDVTESVLVRRERLIRQLSGVTLAGRHVGRFRAAQAAATVDALLTRRSWNRRAERQRMAVALRSLSPDDR